MKKPTPLPTLHREGWLSKLLGALKRRFIREKEQRPSAKIYQFHDRK